MLLALLTLTSASALPASQPRFELPYDLAVARDGTIYFPDRSRVLTLQPSTGRVRIHTKVAGAGELAGLVLARDGTLYAADLPSGRILRIPRGRAAVDVATVPMPVDLVVDPAGTTLWVASIADGVGLVKVDVASGSVEPFAAVRQPHGVARTPGGDFVVHDGHAVSRVEGATGVVTALAKVDAFKVVVARNGVVYGATGGRSGAGSSASRRAVGSSPSPERVGSARTVTGVPWRRRCSRVPSRSLGTETCSSPRSTRCRRSGASTLRWGRLPRSPAGADERRDALGRVRS